MRESVDMGGGFLVKRLSRRAQIPTKGTEWSGGHDLYALDDVVVKAGGVALVHTGIAVELPRGTCGLLFTRSSYGKRMVRLAAGANVIDAEVR